MITLVKLFPLMTGDLVDEEDEHWKCFLLLWDICSIVLAYEVSPNDPVRLAWLVETYLEAFTTLYGASTLTPKIHHFVHFPQQMLL